MFRRKKEKTKEKIFIDLEGLAVPSPADSDARVKIVEVTRYDDLKPITDMAYRGNIMVLDFSRFSDGDAMKREIAKRFLSVSADINGAFTEASERLMVLSPGGLGIDKCRIAYRKDRDV